MKIYPSSIPLCLLMIILSVNSTYAENINKKANQAKEAPGEILAKERKPANQSKKMIEEVMKTKNLDDKKTEMRWVKKRKDKKPDDDTSMNLKWLKTLLESIAKIFATLFETGLWVAILVGLFLLYRFRGKWLHLFQGNTKTEDEYQPPEIMFGMDVRPDSLPKDIVGEAQGLWQSGKHRESLSLLYRGALVHLINQEKVQLQNSDTEGDVLKHAAKRINTSKQDYLQQLTRQWQAIAYAHRKPDEAMQKSMSSLFTQWHSVFVASGIKGDNTAHG